MEEHVAEFITWLRKRKIYVREKKTTWGEVVSLRVNGTISIGRLDILLKNIEKRGYNDGFEVGVSSMKKRCSW